ncbi:MAG: tetratricopeptide repeat protein [Candidatus Hatepunaea meridiana]|nr:tetratricopeptide repeat protein [Candidatus Hatepunaea meridiana]
MRKNIFFFLSLLMLLTSCSGEKIAKMSSKMMVKQTTEAIARNPNNAKPYIEHAFAYMIIKEYDNVIMDCNKVIEIDPHFHDQNIPAGTIFQVRGQAYLEKGEIDQAISDFSLYKEINPEATAAYSSLGDAYRMKGELDEALTEYTKAIEMSPDLDKLYAGRGKVLIDKGDFQSALKDLCKAISFNTRKGEFYFHRGIAYQKTGKTINARRDFQVAKELGYEDAQKELDKLK